MLPIRWGRVLAAWILLQFFSPAAAKPQILIEDSRLSLDGRPFVVRGVVYSNVPVGGVWSGSIEASECLYTRDLPLIAGLGANTVRTLALVPPGSRAFSQALAANDLYWLAGFPLDRFYDSQRSLSSGTGQETSSDTVSGSELRSQILGEFRAYVEAWKDEPRLLAFVFGNEADVDYERKFAGSAADFFSLLGEAAAVVHEVAAGKLITSSVGDAASIGAFNLGTNDANQPGLSFWSLDASGQSLLNPLIQEARTRTAKPVLVSGFGADAYDAGTQSEAPHAQAEIARALARELTLAAGNRSFRLLGGLWGALLDEWWRGGPDPARHGDQAVEVGGDGGQFHPAWSGLFGVARGAIKGLDTLRPREAYFALAQEWGGTPPPGLSVEGPPAVDPGGVRNAASGFEVMAPGSLFALYGENFTAGGQSAAAGPDLPYQLEGVSVCVEGQPAPLYFAAAGEIRAQLPWETATGSQQVVVYRGGIASQPSPAEVLAQAPGIFEGAVLQPGLPCPVDGSNGVRPGAYLEVYGTGLGTVAAPVATGRAAVEPASLSIAPQASLDDRALEVVFAGLLSGTAGVYQTNVRIPPDVASGVAQLRLSQGALVSNAVPVQITGETDSPRLFLSPLEPDALLVQAGGPPRRALARVFGGKGFCDLVRFAVAGLPVGVRASIPVGYPGQAVPLEIWAEPTAPRAEDVPVTLTALSSLADAPMQTVHVTVLPALGDIRFRVVSGGWLSSAPIASFEVDGRFIYRVNGGGPGRGFNFLTVDAQTGELDSVRNFDTWASEEAVTAMENFLQGLPAGRVVFAAIADDGALLLTPETRCIIRETLGSQWIDTLAYQDSWAIISRVGAVQPIAEGLTSDETVILERTLTFPMP
jgi:uncharacterized protein (TIGR03437 family)